MNREQTYQQIFERLRPALLRMAEDGAFRDAFERDPLAALATMDIELDDALRTAMEGRTFSEFWEQQKTRAESQSGSRVQIRDLPPANDAVSEAVLKQVVGGLKLTSEQEIVSRFAPPYVPVGPVVGGDNLATPGHLQVLKDDLDLKKT